MRWKRVEYWVPIPSVKFSSWPNPTRRWVRFSLSGLLLLVAICCAFLSFYFPRIEETAEFRIVGSPIFLETQATLIKSSYVLSAAVGKQGISDLPMLTTSSDPVSSLESQLKVDIDPAEDTMTVRMVRRPKNRGQMKQILDAVTSAYMQEIVDAERRDKQRKLDGLLDTNKVETWPAHIQLDINALEAELARPARIRLIRQPK